MSEAQAVEQQAPELKVPANGYQWTVTGGAKIGDFPANASEAIQHAPELVTRLGPSMANLRYSRFSWTPQRSGIDVDLDHKTYRVFLKEGVNEEFAFDALLGWAMSSRINPEVRQATLILALWAWGEPPYEKC